jgi:hypothetical protein
MSAYDLDRDGHRVPQELLEEIDTDAISFVTGTDSTVSGTRELGHSAGVFIKRVLRGLALLKADKTPLASFPKKSRARLRLPNGYLADMPLSSTIEVRPRLIRLIFSR